MNAVTLSQLDSLRGLIKDNYDNSLDLGDCYKCIKNITYPQYKYLLHLIFSKKHIKAMEVLQQLGLKRKTL